jgi:hypothetical protein
LNLHPQPASPAGLPGASAPGERNSRRRILDTYKDADGLPVTATFAAFMLEGGFRSYREAQDSEGYDAWYSARWEQFCRSQPGRPPMALMPMGDDRSRFVDWLDQRAVDHVARNAVEAA